MQMQNAQMQKAPMQNAPMQTNANVKVFRYKLCDEMMSLITQFAQVHQYDDRLTYKEAWQTWVIQQQNEIDAEKRRLKQLGYTGDVEDKMFKAGRYYFRGKVATETAEAKTAAVEEGNEKKPRDYVVMNPDIIQMMDRQLADMMTNNNFTPANGFIQFCQSHAGVLREEITRLIQQNKNITSTVLSTKIKKTYKNRYYMLNKNRIAYGSTTTA